MANPFLVDDEAPQVNSAQFQQGMPAPLQQALNTRPPQPKPDQPGFAKQMFSGFLQGMRDGLRSSAGLPTDAEEEVTQKKLELERMQQQTQRMNAESQAGAREALEKLNQLRGTELQIEKVTDEEAKLMGNPALAGIEMNAKAKASMLKGFQGVQAQKERQVAQQSFADKQQKDRFAQQWGLEKFRQGNTNNRMNTRMTLMREMAAGGSVEAATELWSDAVANGEAKLTEVPPILRSLVLKAKVDNGDTFVPPAVRKNLSEFNQGLAAVEEAKKWMEKYIASGDISDGLMFRSKLKGFGTLVGRSVGNNGVFTDQDQERVETLLSPVPVLGAMGAPLAPGMSREAMRGVEELLDDVRTRNFDSYISKVGGKSVKPSGGKPKSSVPVYDINGNLVSK